MEVIANEVHKPTFKPKQYRKVFVDYVNDIWSADIVEMKEYEKINDGYKYILTVIDIFSRFAWTKPLKNKNAVSVAEAFKDILDEVKQKPNALWVDMGKEFYNKEVKKVMEGVNIYSTFGEAKAAYIERLNRTLKNMMFKKLTILQSRRWIDILEDIVKQYNNKKHRSINQKPKDMFKNGDKKVVEIQGLPDTKPKFKVGDRVRISYKRRAVFDKAYYAGWTWEIFIVSKVNHSNPWTYKLKDYNNEEIEGSFYESEIQKTKQKGDVYLVEEILKTKREKGKKYVLVKWLGYPESSASWIPESDLKGFKKLV